MIGQHIVVSLDFSQFFYPYKFECFIFCNVENRFAFLIAYEFSFIIEQFKGIPFFRIMACR